MPSTTTPLLTRLAGFLRNSFRALWLFFPGVLFLLLTYQCFWKLSQGKDLMVLATEKKWFFILFQVLLAFLVLVSWYTARLVGNAKQCSPRTAPGFLRDGYYKHMPRFIGFSFFTIILLAFAQTPIYSPVIIIKGWDSGFYILMFLLSIPYYFLLSKAFERRFKFIRINKLFWITLIIIVTGSVLITFNIQQYDWLVLFMLLVLQACFVILVVTRREMIAREEQVTATKRSKPGDQLAQQTASLLHIPREEARFHLCFLIITIIAITIYALCTISVPFAVQLGSFSFVLLAFALFLGIGFTLSFISIRAGLNIHFIVLFFVFLFGQWTERHRVALIDKDKMVQDNFSNKAGLRDYFIKWVQDRDSLIRKAGEFPVYFVLSDGGASRSGYWVGSVLGKLEDTSAHAFSKHLFCLSGASGGSVGNAAYYALLQHASKQPGNNLTNNQSFYEAGKEYLSNDFLTYTLSRMLGHDFFVQLLPFSTHGDRAKALTMALEEAPADSVLLKNQLRMPLSALSIYKNKVHTELPILCVNTTRMQDGLPSVISTIDIDPLTFNNRIDVLDKLNNDQDMKLSTAVVLGASFPYVSPAGRIDHVRVRNGEEKIYPNYFVDGGYVDNSGAGVVHEMLIKLNYWRDSICRSNTDTLLFNNCKKLSFYVIHITNGPEGELLVEKVNPFVNDLAAPMKTLMGAYMVQTNINDNRLKSYLRNHYGNELHYKPINLFRRSEPMKYSMNWVISRRTLDSMDARLYSPDVRTYFGRVLQELNR
jgi:hypothetical protein